MIGTSNDDNVGDEQARPGMPQMRAAGFRALYEFFAPTREYIRASGITQEELYADIDAAIAEVRAEQGRQIERSWRPDADSD